MIRSEKLVQLRQAEYVLPVWKENGNCSHKLGSLPEYNVSSDKLC